MPRPSAKQIFSDDAGDNDLLVDSRSATGRRRKCFKMSLFDYKGVMGLFEKHNIKASHAYTIWRHFLQCGCTSVDEVPNLPKAAYRLVKEHCSYRTLTLVRRQDSKDGSTTKLLLKLQDGNSVETVIMRYGQVDLSTFPQVQTCHTFMSTLQHLVASSIDGIRKYRSAPRATVCVSSQVGCAMGCRFCATGTMGLLSNLTSGEILEQLMNAMSIEPIRNVVFMGMGEPLDNYEEVIDAIRLMTDPRAFQLASHRISVSTVGVVPRLRQLQQDAPDISLALSLHAPTQELRERIVPSAKAWNIDAILDATVDFVVAQKSRTRTYYKNQNVLLEYVLIKDINCTPEVACLLGELLRPRAELFQLNVIPYNPSVDDPGLHPPSQAEIDTFVKIVRGYCIKVTVRQTLGQDISGACGQLVINSKECSANAQDIEDVVPSCMTKKLAFPSPGTLSEIITSVSRLSVTSWGSLASIACTAVALAVFWTKKRQLRQ